eukprot:CAMPEP_0168620342 /NCGR_PEP_ID=MMETSP0449_2-20121227/7084_1 /TAXON_ID=1082188 /ORGANISM="Strombidium rassoulzadegani, Strain ras09" /LENGTH=156 /DNA_ID=CAMNT_0008661337 /DNA_START=1074 /DNA_END=1540 /DNA_ORIENTATION=-
MVDFLSNGFDYESGNSSIFGALFIVGGILGSVAFGIYVEKTLRYRAAVLGIATLSLLLNLVVYFVMPLGILWVTCCLFTLVGFSMVPILAVSFDFAVELTYPIGESYSTGVLMSASQIVGVIQIVISTFLMNKDETMGSKVTIVIISGSCLLSFIV